MNRLSAEFRLLLIVLLFLVVPSVLLSLWSFGQVQEAAQSKHNHAQIQYQNLATQIAQKVGPLREALAQKAARQNTHTFLLNHKGQFVTQRPSGGNWAPAYFPRQNPALYQKAFQLEHRQKQYEKAAMEYARLSKLDGLLPVDQYTIALGESRNLRKAQKPNAALAVLHKAAEGDLLLGQKMVLWLSAWELPLDAKVKEDLGLPLPAVLETALWHERGAFLPEDLTLWYEKLSAVDPDINPRLVSYIKDQKTRAATVEKLKVALGKELMTAFGPGGHFQTSTQPLHLVSEDLWIYVVYKEDPLPEGRVHVLQLDHLIQELARPYGGNNLKVTVARKRPVAFGPGMPVGQASVLVEPLSGFGIWVFPEDAQKFMQSQQLVGRTQLWTIMGLMVALVVGFVWAGRQVIREMKLSRLKSDFVSNVTHELKTPLTSIRMFVETLLLGRVEDQAEQRECLEVIDRETQRLSRLIERILEFSRLESGKRNFKRVPTHLARVTDEVMVALKDQIAEAQMTLDLSYEEGLSPILLDPDAVAEVLYNLVGNAIKYAASGKSITVRVAQEGDHQVLLVSDRGPGIPTGEQSRIFEKWERLDDRLSRDVDGSGLGLTLARFLVEGHNGTLTVSHRQGGGAEFRAKFPQDHH